MLIEEFFNRENIMDLSFFNFRNALSATFYADADLRIQRANENFGSFFPDLGNVTGLSLQQVLKRLGVANTIINSYLDKLEKQGSVLIPHIQIMIDDKERDFSLMSVRTHDNNFSYLNGYQGQFIDRTPELEMRKERDRLMEQKVRDQRVIKEKSKQLEKLANRLAKYLSPQIYASIFSGANETPDKFTRKNLTIFFSDIEGFTDISDGLEPERLAFMVNTYLSEMSDIALEFGGTIDKFIGDAVLVFFGDPESAGEQEDAFRCAKMALRMQQKVKELKKLWVEKGITRPIRVRMGINTGYCTVGNFGSEQRLEYTILGSPVNLAARLQTAAESDTILISESTFLILKDRITYTEGKQVLPKGFLRPIETYRLDGIKEEKPDGTIQSVTKVGKHVEVNIPDMANIREAILELRKIHDEFKAELSDK